MSAPPMSADTARRAVNEASTPPDQLAQIAHHFPDLRTAVAWHPAVYPGLLDWMARYDSGPAARVASGRLAAVAAQTDMSTLHASIHGETGQHSRIHPAEAAQVSPEVTAAPRAAIVPPAVDETQPPMPSPTPAASSTADPVPDQPGAEGPGADAPSAALPSTEAEPTSEPVNSDVGAGEPAVDANASDAAPEEGADGTPVERSRWRRGRPAASRVVDVEPMGEDLGVADAELGALLNPSARPRPPFSVTRVHTPAARMIARVPGLSSPAAPVPAPQEARAQEPPAEKPRKARGRMTMEEAQARMAMAYATLHLIPPSEMRGAEAEELAVPVPDEAAGAAGAAGTGAAGTGVAAPGAGAAGTGAAASGAMKAPPAEPTQAAEPAEAAPVEKESPAITASRLRGSWRRLGRPFRDTSVLRFAPHGAPRPTQPTQPSAALAPPGAPVPTSEPAASPSAQSQATAPASPTAQAEVQATEGAAGQTAASAASAGPDAAGLGTAAAPSAVGPEAAPEQASSAASLAPAADHLETQAGTQAAPQPGAQPTDADFAAAAPYPVAAPDPGAPEQAAPAQSEAQAGTQAAPQPAAQPTDAGFSAAAPYSVAEQEPGAPEQAAPAA
ncbi:MAG: hypothetical protein LBH48_04410, partial [Bifidobacteriaceae bacterium]|nr:hypothetical protein [Bifidobacteriaceae bacterium]